MHPTKRAYIELHLAVILYGFTAILGKLILLDAVILVWWRVFFTSISLLFFINLIQTFKTIPRKHLLQFLGIGILVALHWMCFFGAIHLSNASIGVVCVATSTLFTAILEPIIMKQNFKWFEIGIGLLVIPGMVLIVNSTDISMQMGIWVGLISAFLAALFGTINKKLIHHADAFQITFLELGSAWLFLSALIPFYYIFQDQGIRFFPNAAELIYLLILALVCTTGGYILGLRALKHISAFASNLAINLEPIYGILLAILIFKENKELTPTFYLGVIIILISVFGYPLLKRYFERKPSARL